MKLKDISAIFWVILKEGLLPVLFAVAAFYVGGLVAYIIAVSLAILWLSRGVIKEKMFKFD